MAYIPYIWKDDPTGGTPITAARLNAIEGAVSATSVVADNAATAVNVIKSNTGSIAYSAAPSGSDDTSALQVWLNGLPPGATASVRAGSYQVSSITVPASITLLGYGAVWKASSGTSNFVILGAGSKIIGLELDGTARTGSANALVTAANTVGQIIDGLYVHNWPSGGIAIQNCNDWLVTRCRVVDTKTAGISATFASRGRITGNTTVNANGIQWWGGDSAAVTTLGISDIVITGNLVVNGGIWGSCGSGIVVTGNTVDGAGDVGIDFEGCADSVASGNVVKNAVNACYAVFYGSKRCSFVGNIALQDSTGNIGAGFKAFTSGTNSQLLVADNVFTTKGAAGITCDQSALSHSSFRGNTIVVNASDVPAVRLIDSNSISFTHNNITTNGVVGISWEGCSDGRIENNQILSTIANDNSGINSATGGLYMVWRSSGFPVKRNRVRYNTIRGFVQSVFDNCYGDTNAFNLIEDNIAARVVMRNGSTSIQANNRDDSVHGVISATLV